MAMNIKNEKVERLAEELAHITGETKTAAILRALEERREKIARRGPGKRRMAQPSISSKTRSGPTFRLNCWAGV